MRKKNHTKITIFAFSVCIPKKNIVDDYGLKNNMDIPENYELKIEEIYDVANAVLSKVHETMLDETKKVIDQALED